MDYTYFAQDLLNKNINELELFSKLYLCTYRINKPGKYPFIEFIMEHMVDMFSFPLVSCKTREELEVVLDKFCASNKTFSGFLEHSSDYYLFFESHETITDGNLFYKQDKHWPISCDEILTMNSCCNIPINLELVEFFMTNPFLFFVNSEDYGIYEVPVVKYVGVCEPLIKMRSIFGTPPEDKTEIMGPYYYFTDFNGAVKSGGWSKNNAPEYQFEKLVTEETCGKYKKGGVIRFALFLGKMMVPTNNKDEAEDLSLTKKALEELDDKHKQTRRISDHDGVWTEKYDSVKLSNIELDDGKLLTENPIWVLCEYDRIVPISYHIIDKTTLGESWSRDGVYQIQ